MEEIQLILAKNLKAIREKEKLSLEKVSQLSGVSKTMIGQIERGESSPTLTTIALFNINTLPSYRHSCSDKASSSSNVSFDSLSFLQAILSCAFING